MYGIKIFKKLASKKIYLIRHGETDFNKQGIVQGSGVDSSLNDTGRKQADAFFNKYKDTGFEKIYLSNLQRTHQSVKRFLDLGIPFEKLEGLNEICWGTQEGKPNTAEGVASYQDMLRKWQDGLTDLRMEGGESPAEVAERQKPAWEKIISGPEELILVCTHGRALRILLSWIMQRSLQLMDEFKHTNLGLYILEYKDDRYFIEAANDTSHLFHLSV